MNKKEQVDLTGQQFGSWTVLSKTSEDTKPRKGRFWRVICECGTEKDIAEYHLTGGKSKSCGCKTTKFKDLTGQKFGSWTVLYRVPRKTGTAGNAQWHVICECGAEKDISGSSLTSGRSKSCGCKSHNRLKDITDQRFGRLVAKERIKKNGRTYWICECDCGNTKEVLLGHLTSGKIQSCGCLHRDLISENCLSIKPGDKFNRLTVIERYSPVGQKPVLWRCLCECGAETIVATDRLKGGHTKSCGCLHKEVLAQHTKTHGMTDTKLYNVWRGMITRCTLETSKEYKYYGAFGIKVCDEWKNSFENFYNWSIANGYDSSASRHDMTIDRCNPFEDYSPDNCRWVSMEVQASNTKYHYLKRLLESGQDVSCYVGKFNPENKSIINLFNKFNLDYLLKIKE